MLANEWGKSWYPIVESIDNYLNIEIQNMCTRIDNKRNKPKTAQISNNCITTTNLNFYPRIVNNTDIVFFSKDELILFNKELKYNLQLKKTVLQL